MDKRTLRKLHRFIAPIIFIPLFATGFTGISYRVAKSWFGASDKLGYLLMYIHQGTFLGKELRVLYVLLNGLGLIAMLISGIVMTGIFRNKPIQN